MTEKLEPSQSDEAMKNKLDKFFNTEVAGHLPVITQEPEKVEDIDYTLVKLKKILELGEEVLSNSATIAVSTGESEPVKALSMLIKALNDTARTLIKNKHVDRVTKHLDKQKEMLAGGDVTNNAIFIGTGKELLNSIKAAEQHIKDSTIDVVPIQEEIDEIIE